MRVTTPYHIGSFISHYALAIAALSGAAATGSPVSLGVATALSGVLVYISLKANKEFFENNLKAHPDKHRYSPNLKKIVQGLYERSGLKPHKHHVYDFNPSDAYMRKEQKGLGVVFAEGLRKAAKTPNAAALNLGKPIIIISQPLLQVLNDEEEKAVLAHEFAHAVGMHQHVAMPVKFIGMLSRTSNTLMMLGAFFTSGFVNIATALGAGAVTGYVAGKLHPRRDLAKHNSEDPSLAEIRAKRDVSQQRAFTSGLSANAVLAYADKDYAILWASVVGLNTATKLIEGSLSQSKEFQADRGAVALGADPLAMMTALRKINALMKRSKEAAWGDAPMAQPGWISRTWKNATATHPSVERRIARLSDIARVQGYSAEQIDHHAKGPVDISHAPNLPYDILKEMAMRFY